MRDLAAQVSSGLLRFPTATVDALAEDEVTLDSELRGRFSTGRGVLAWLACGPNLEVVHASSGERVSAYRFSGVTDHTRPSVTVAKEFGWLKRSGLLVGLQEDESSMLCLYDLGISRVVKAVVIPNRITAIEPLASYGGASAHTQHLHQSLRWFFGVVAVVTDLGHVLLVDLCLDDLSCTQTELEASDLEVLNKSPGDIPRLREGTTRQGRHLCLQLRGPTGTGASALQFIGRTNQLAVGFTDGVLQLWNMKTLKQEYRSQLEGGPVPVYAFTFQEPENDPRNCCYLWAVQSAQDLEGDVVSLHLLQLAFGERKCLASGKILYEGLEYCEERYSQDLNGAAVPLRAQASNTRLLSCQTIEKFRHHPDREDSVNEVASPDTSVAVFSWQVKSYGQGHPSTYVSVFDINRWYHAQMPDSLRMGESMRSCPYLAVWSMDSVLEVTQSCPLLDVVVHERSLSRALPHTCPPPEQFYNPNTYNFDASCLLSAGVVHFTCCGYQKETLTYLMKSLPSLADGISNGYSRCLMSGLLSSRLADVQPSSLSEQEQLDAILTMAVETSALGLITGCIKEWSTEERAGSTGNLRYILEWAWDKVVKTKEELDSICAPLFDCSSNFTDPQTLQLLQRSLRILTNLSTVFHCLLNQAQELTQKGVMGLMNKCMVSSLISQYAQVVLWFCRTGLLPESSDDDVLQISRPFYSFSVIKNYYTGQREELQRLAKDKWSADCLMIDGLVSQCGERLSDLWRRDQGGTGQYPPPSLHALLDLYLLENVEESAKHAIVIYLLLDVMYSFPNKSGASVESFPTAFSIPIGLVKLVQGLWLLDHHDHENALDLLLHPSVSQCVWAWQHSRVLQTLMIQNKQGTALRYLHMTRPSLSSTPQIKLCISVLLHNRCTVEAWALLRQHVNKLSKDELLQFFYEMCQELGLMKDLLKLPLTPSEQECLERFLQGSGGYQNRELLMVHYLQQANYIPALQINQTLNMNLAGDRDPKMKERSNTRNSIMNQYGKVLPRAQRKLAMERAKPYQRPPTIHREVSRPQPLSAMAKRPNESVLSRATFIKNVLTKIEEVWVLRDTTPESSPLRSPKGPEAVESSPSPPAAALPQAFVGTPINMLTKRMSRLLDLAVHPSPSHASPERSRVQTTPTKPLSSWAPPKHVSKAPELSLLQTPQVVKRARALAASGPVFTSFTPQSILRTSLRPTPIATPTGSPARSASPPLRSKESRITFLEESDTVQRSSVRWSNGLAVETARKLKRPSSPPEGGVEAWSEHSAEEDENDKDYKDQDEEEAEPSRLVLPPLERRPSLGHETSKLSIQSDSTLEFHDALSPAAISGRMNDTDEIVIVGTTDPAEPHPGALPDQPEESNSKIIESNQDDSVNQEKDSEPEPIRILTTPEEPIADPNEPISGTPPKESQSLAEEEAREEAEPIREPPAPKVSETEAMETSDLDDYVQRHLFGTDLSPPYDHSAEAVDEADKPVTSSEAATSDSHSVVTLHDSDELSSTKSEQQQEDEEDSGSEVEIIQEVKGDSPQQQHLYLQDLPSDHEEEDEDRFLEDQTAAAVLSLVSDPQLKMMDGCEEEEGEVVMVGLEPETLGTDEAEVCYTELKPSTTLLVPIELSADHQELLPDLGLPPGSNDFSLVLEADDEETPPAETIAHGDEESEKRAPDSTDGAGTEPDHGARVEEMVQSERPVEDQPEGTTDDQPEDQREDKEVEPVTESEPQEKDQPEKEAQTEEEPLEEPEEVHFDKIQDSGVSEEVQSERNEVINRTDLAEVAAEAIPVGPDLISDSTHHEESLKPVEPQRSPGRRGRRTVTFLKSATESEKDVSDEQSDPKVPSTPRRITRSSALLPDSHVPVTPRRSVRKAEPEPEEAAVPRASPGCKTPTRGTCKTRSTSANSSDEEAQKTQSVPDRILEDKGAETRVNTKASPSRVTRQSSRSVSLVLQSFQEFSEEVSVRTVTPPRSRRKTRGATEAADETQLQNVSRRLTRSRHWHDDEGALQKTEALEAPNPLESALLERLNDAKESEAVTEIVRAKRSTTRSALERAPTEEPKEEPPTEKEANTEIVHARRRTTRSVAPPIAENADAEQKEKKKSVQSVRRTRASKVPESSSPPSESTSTSTSVHQSTRGRRKEVIVPDVLSPPVTRTRRAASVPEDEVQSDDIGVEAEAKPRKTRASRARAAPAPVEINFLSPLPSPAERPRKKAEERGATAPKLSLRRKRVMEAVFPKPVTRRKKL